MHGRDPRARRPRQRRELRFRCFICGDGTDWAFDYVSLELATHGDATRQYLGAHAACLTKVAAPGIPITLHED
jgi:hypothetical protein